MRAEIIAVGSELLTPERLDTNSLFLTAQLNSIGIRVTHKSVVGDAPEEMHSSFRDALARADVVVSSGGLGPTDDDRTRDAVSQLLGRSLQMNDDVLDRLKERFRRFGRSMPEINKRQAMVPEGAVILPNPRGTAPGLWIEANDRIVILLPGVPLELHAIFETEVKPRLARLAPSERLFTRDLRINGLPESEVEARVRPLYALYPDVDVTILAGPTGIQLHPRIWSSDGAKAEAILDEIADRMALALGDSLFSRRGEKIEEIVGRLLVENRATIAVAESCTGGMLAEYLTNVPGSSIYFLGGMICYSNEMKTSLAGVPAELIEAKGAVSPEVAQALAEGVRNRIGATIGVGVTGIAGPGGGTPEKPVGLIHIGLAAETGSCVRRIRFPGADRERNRQLAAQAALDMVRRHLLFSTNLGSSPPGPCAVLKRERRRYCMRLFIALDIPEETRETLGELMARLHQKCKAAQWVRSESMHLTLKFIGHVETEKLLPITRALADIRDAHSIDAEFRGMGTFPSARRPRVLWVGVDATPNLAELAWKMDAGLAVLGIPSEKRAFSPHLTLARFNSHDLHQRGKPLPGLSEIVKEAEAAQDKSFGSMRASEFHLFESKLKSSGAEYTRIETFPFVEPVS